MRYGNIIFLLMARLVVASLFLIALPLSKLRPADCMLSTKTNVKRAQKDQSELSLGWSLTQILQTEKMSVMVSRKSWSQVFASTLRPSVPNPSSMIAIKVMPSSRSAVSTSMNGRCWRLDSGLVRLRVAGLRLCHGTCKFRFVLSRHYGRHNFPPLDQLVRQGFHSQSITNVPTCFSWALETFPHLLRIVWTANDQPAYFA